MPENRTSPSLQSRRIFIGYDTGYEYSMPPSWMIKLAEGWGEPKKDSEGEGDDCALEEVLSSLSIWTGNIA